METFKLVDANSNSVDDAIMVAERLLSNGGTDVASLIEDEDEGFILTIEYSNNSKPNFEKTFEDKDMAIAEFNKLIK